MISNEVIRSGSNHLLLVHILTIIARGYYIIMQLYPIRQAMLNVDTSAYTSRCDTVFSAITPLVIFGGIATDAILFEFH